EAPSSKTRLTALLAGANGPREEDATAFRPATRLAVTVRAVTRGGDVGDARDHDAQRRCGGHLGDAAELGERGAGNDADAGDHHERVDLERKRGRLGDREEGWCVEEHDVGPFRQLLQDSVERRRLDQLRRVEWQYETG